MITYSATGLAGLRTVKKAKKRAFQFNGMPFIIIIEVKLLQKTSMLF
jgi:hypothetical protein